jgi:hypothetical protein
MCPTVGNSQSNLWGPSKETLKNLPMHVRSMGQQHQHHLGASRIEKDESGLHFLEHHLHFNEIPM